MAAGRFPVAVVAAGTAVVAVATIVALVAGPYARPTVLYPQPDLTPYIDFNMNDGTAGPLHNYHKLDFQLGKATASQEWLQYSLHHDGTLQQARGLPRRFLPPSPPGEGEAAASRGVVGSPQAGIVETKGNFFRDDSSLFGSNAPVSNQKEAISGQNMGDGISSKKMKSTTSSARKTTNSGGVVKKPSAYKKSCVDSTGAGTVSPCADDDADDFYCVDDSGKVVPCDGDYEYYCEDENGNEVPCDDFCFDENGKEVPCEDSKEEEEEKEAKKPEPSDFLRSIVKALSSEVMPPEASRVLKKSTNSVKAAKQELKEAATLKADASADEKHAQALEPRVAELEKYEEEKQEFAASAEELARKAEEEYEAEARQVKSMDDENSTPASDEWESGAGEYMKGAGGGHAALRHRLQRHLPILRVVNKLAQRMGALNDAAAHEGAQGTSKTAKSRGRHPRLRRT